MPRASPDLATRKKMRKGTHSCFECRRRKIRCIFPPENPNVCSECFARGSRCIDQEHADSDTIVDQRKNLRERVSRLEALVDSLLEDRVDRTAAEALRNLRSDPIPPTPHSSDNAASILDNEDMDNTDNPAPLLSMFNNAVFSRAETQISVQTPSEGSAGKERASVISRDLAFRGILTPESTSDANYSSASKAKHERTRRALLAALPPYEQLVRALHSGAEWWQTWRTKSPGTTGIAVSLYEFGSRVLGNPSNVTPGELGTLVLAVGISLDNDDFDRHLSIVERHITMDDEYAATLEGMECITLSTKVYADIGQPRKAWLAYRRALTFAQLIGLPRNHSTSTVRTSIWWSIYQGDRFLSLLLGLPYGIPDDHCDLTIKDANVGPFISPTTFLVKLCIITGRVIDRTQGTRDQSYSSALDLDQELENLTSQLPAAWWDNSCVMIDGNTSAADLRERLLSQMCFHQIRVYLHLPFMLKSATNPRFEYSRKTCLDSAREMLRLYQLLRCGTGEPLYECKAIDFVGFTAAVLIILGLLGYGRLGPVQDPQQQESDWRLIEISMDIFQRASSEKGGKVAAQSYRVLQQLSAVRTDPRGTAECINSGYTPAKIIIPYFGTISLKCGSQFNIPSTSTGASTSASPSISSASSIAQNTPSSQLDHTFPPYPISSNTSNMSTHPSNNNAFIAYDGFYMPTTVNNGFEPSQHASTSAGGDEMMGMWGPTATNGFSWQNVPNMDIDQDWSLFMGDGQSFQQQQQPPPQHQFGTAGLA